MIMEQHQIQSLLGDPGSSPAEFEEKIRGLSSTQLDTIMVTALGTSNLPPFVNTVLFEKFIEEIKKETLKAAGSVELSDLRSNLPFCNDCTDSDANISPNHHGRSRIQTFLNFDKVQNIPDSIWNGIINIKDDDNPIMVHSKNSVVFYLAKLYEGLIHAAGAGNKIQVFLTRMVGGNECDIVLAAKETFEPLSVTEVRKPHSLQNDEDIFLLSTGNNGNRRRSTRLSKTSKTIGQHFDQLHNIKWMTGSKKVYGMISTGISFMFTCTDSLSHTTEQLTIPTEIFSSETDRVGGDGGGCVSPAKPILSNDEESETAPVYSPHDDDEKLHTSQVITIPKVGDREAPSKQIVNMLILQIARAMECLKNLDTSDTKLPGKGKVYSRQIDLEPSNERTVDKQCFKEINLVEGWQACRNHYIDSDVKTVSLIRSVGSGGSGDCGFAVSLDQDRSCVIKFFQASSDITTLELAKLEKKNWDKAYGTDEFETRVVTLGTDSGCLAMPYVDIAGVNRDECLDNDSQQLRDCLERFSCRNERSYLLHRDVKWRHLGYLQGKLTLIDLGYVEETKGKRKWKQWMDDCVKALVNSKSSGGRKRAREN